MKWSVLASLFLAGFLNVAAPAQNKMVFQDIDENPIGWGSCTSCANGKHNAGVYWMAPYQTAPSLDGSSTQFYVSAHKTYSDVLFWDNLGAEDWATHFTWDFWVYLDNASVGAQALEYDIFQFTDGVEYMFGTQCVYASGLWNVWNGGDKRWVPIQVPCQKFSPNAWHHIVWQVHRTADTQMHYDSLTIDKIKYTVSVVEPSGPLPKGWADSVGVQWQLDTASAPLAFNEWVDKVNLTIH